MGSVAKAKACAATCPMTFYESKDRAVVSVVRDVVKNVQSMSAFLEDEGRLARDTASKNGNHSVAAAKRTMIDAFPEIAKAPNGFDWPLAFDYFTCRRAHDLPVSREVSKEFNINSDFY